MEHFAPGTTLQNGKYRIDAVVGKGGFGVTYVGEHTMLLKKVAIKEFFPKQYCDRNTQTNLLSAFSESTNDAFQKFRRKFIREAITLSRLTHPNIVSSVDVFEENNTAYYVMDFIDGRSLQEITAEGPLSVNDALRYVRKIGEALSYIHSHQIMHLDVKPANIMVRSSDDEPILIDFGLAKNYNPDSGDSTNTNTLGISQGYSPLEQYTGEIFEFTPKSDLYALGGTLYRMLTGKTPPEPSKMLNDGFPEMPDNVPASVIEPLKKAMAVIRRNRYNSVDQFLAELPTEVAESGKVPPMHPKPPTPPHTDEPADESTRLFGDNPISEHTQLLDSKPTPKINNGNGNNGNGNGNDGNGNDGNDSTSRPNYPPTDPYNYDDEPKPKKRNYTTLIIIAAFLVLGAIVGIIWHNAGSGDKTSDNTDSVPEDDAVMVENVTLTDPTGKVFRYTGFMCPFDSLPDGNGKAWFSGTNYSKYEGGFKEGLWHGHGELALRNGDQVVGEFFEGEIMAGVYIEGVSGDYFRGKFHNSNPFEGSWRSSSGEVIDSIHEGKNVPLNN